jgi:predicted amidophosphoribosyltransferase
MESELGSEKDKKKGSGKKKKSGDNEVTCPLCHNSYPAGTLFCEECGKAIGSLG